MPKPLEPRNLSDAALAMIANRFKVLSEVPRLKLIIQLQDVEKIVTQLVNATGVAQANVSRHLQTLAEAGIVTRRREGQNAFYRICDPGVFGLCKHVCGSLQRHFEDQAKAARLFSG
jgi:ArsR family transcriptional regulator